MILLMLGFQNKQDLYLGQFVNLILQNFIKSNINDSLPDDGTLTESEIKRFKEELFYLRVQLLMGSLMEVRKFGNKEFSNEDIGETTVIGKNVKIYQGVTLGALSVDKNQVNSKRHPTIEDDVILYSQAVILGGDTIIGKNSIVGGNAWVTQSVPSNSVVYSKSEVRVRSNEQYFDTLEYII